MPHHLSPSAHDETTVWVNLRVEGIHCYPEALTDPKLKDVSFLGHPHRHIFHINIELKVDHDNRDVEFILFKREMEASFGSIIEIDHKSCEMLCKDIVAYIDDKYPGKFSSVSVSEDGENGATVKRPNRS